MFEKNLKGKCYVFFHMNDGYKTWKKKCLLSFEIEERHDDDDVKKYIYKKLLLQKHKCLKKSLNNYYLFAAAKIIIIISMYMFLNLEFSVFSAQFGSIFFAYIIFNVLFFLFFL